MRVKFRLKTMTLKWLRNSRSLSTVKIETSLFKNTHKRSSSNLCSLSNNCREVILRISHMRTKIRMALTISSSKSLQPNRTKMALKHLPKKTLKRRKKRRKKNRSFSITLEHNFRPTINKLNGKTDREAKKGNMSKENNTTSWSRKRVITFIDWLKFSIRRMIKPTSTDHADTSQLPTW